MSTSIFSTFDVTSPGLKLKCEGIDNFGVSFRMAVYVRSCAYDRILSIVPSPCSTLGEEGLPVSLDDLVGDLHDARLDEGLVENVFDTGSLRGVEAQAFGHTVLHV